MADTRKRNRRNIDEEDKPTKEELTVAKFLRFNVPTNVAKLHSMEVHCFFASTAVDALLQSKWSSSQNAKEPLFFNRQSCISYCQRLLEKGLFHRADRVLRKKVKGEKSKKKKVKDSTVKDDGGTGDEIRERRRKKDKKEKEDAAPEVAEQEEEGKEDDAKEEEMKEEKKEESKKKKKEKPFKLTMTDDQRFLDGEENIYVWVYDPASTKTLLIGSLIVLGTIALCLFPVWPPVVRVGVYYVSLVAAGFVSVILSLVVLRFVLFCLVWLGSAGRHHFWLLPNLTEDVGILESFQPWYTHSLVDKQPPNAKDKGGKASSKSSKKGKAKSSDKEDSASEQDEFEMIQRGDVEAEAEEEEEGEEEENRVEGEAEDDYKEDDEEEEEVEDEEEGEEEGGEEDQDGDEENQNEEGEEEEGGSELKKDK